MDNKLHILVHTGLAENISAFLSPHFKKVGGFLKEGQGGASRNRTDLLSFITEIGGLLL